MAVGYRKTREGKWVAFGPTTEVRTGPLTITTKAGKRKQETVVSLGRPFDVGGVEHVYGYLAENGNGSSSSGGRRRRRSSRDWPGKECPVCESEPLDNNLSCWECGYRGKE